MAGDHAVSGERLVDWDGQPTNVWCPPVSAKAFHKAEQRVWV